MKIEQEYKDLEEKAVSLLDFIGFSKEVPTNQKIKDLDYYAGQLSKIAYGNNRPELVVGEIYNLISWCDHIHEKKIKQQFSIVVCSRPLVSPAWSSS